MSGVRLLTMEWKSGKTDLGPKVPPWCRWHGAGLLGICVARSLVRKVNSQALDVS